MKQAVWTGSEINFTETQDSPPPPRRRDDVRLRILAAGVCGTDVHIWEGRISFAKPPIILGHEFVGVVDACGPDVRRVKPGDRVKCDSVVGCGQCPSCRRNATQFCPEAMEFGITVNGGWAQWLVAPERNLYHLPDTISDEVAAVMDVEVMGAFRKPGICTGDTVAVFGAGPAGLIAIQCARIRSAGTVILCGTRSERLALGKRLGADHVIDVSRTDVEAEIKSLTGGRGVDLAFDAAGTEKAILDALKVVRPQGRVVLYGVPDRGIPDFPAKDVVLKDLVVYGALSDRTGWEELIELVAGGRIDLQSLITHRFPLERAGEALSIMRDRRDGAIKAVLRIAESSASAPAGARKQVA
jgi:threonine dehydrogenase-like Zn-dependent dehydrogenase